MEPIGQPADVTVNRVGVGRCFGCGLANDQGLRMTFVQYPDGTVESRHSTAAHHCGVDTVVHGGIQATLLDEVMGVAAQLALASGASTAPCVTAEMALAYRRPVPMDGEVVARARLRHVNGRDFHVEGAIVSAEGDVLTSATSRWRQLREVPPAENGS